MATTSRCVGRTLNTSITRYVWASKNRIEFVGKNKKQKKRPKNSLLTAVLKYVRNAASLTEMYI